MRLRAVADIPESGLSDICNHPPPRLPTGRLKRNKIKKPPLAVKKARLTPGQKELLWEAPPRPFQGVEVHTCCVLGCLSGSFPLGKAGMWLLCWLVRTPDNSNGVAFT